MCTAGQMPFPTSNLVNGKCSWNKDLAFTKLLRRKLSRHLWQIPYLKRSRSWAAESFQCAMIASGDLDMRKFVSLVFCVLMPFIAAGKAKPASLQIYFVDVEGGQATLIVSPSGQSLL